MFDVVIPWREGQEDRQRIFEWVHERWRRLFPAANVLVTDSGSHVFSRSASRNLGAAQGSSDVIVFADADTIPIPAFVEPAIKSAGDQKSWFLPYGPKDYYNLSKRETRKYLNLSPLSPVMRPTISEYEHKLLSWAGIVVVPRVAFDFVGGYDENFVGWGHEDLAFRLALDNEWGPHKRIDEGYVVHLYHDRIEATFDTDQEVVNRKYFDANYRRKYKWVDERR